MTVCCKLAFPVDVDYDDYTHDKQTRLSGRCHYCGKPITVVIPHAAWEIDDDEKANRATIAKARGE